MTDASAILEERLPSEQLRVLRAAGEFAAERDSRLYLVGGVVRDLLLSLPTVGPDLDIVAVGVDAGFAAGLAERLHGELVSSSQFGTWKIALGSLRLDLVRARRESYERPGALPTVEPGAVDDDLARRDFSINAMALSLDSATWGDLLDPHDGRRDLERRHIRVLHPASFSDDGTRMLRAARYAGRLNFELEPDTRRLLTQDLAHLSAISGDRVRHELEHIVREDGAAAILGLCQGLGILAAIHPRLRVEERTLAALRRLYSESEEGREVIVAALLAYPLTPAEGQALTRRLNLGVEWAKVVADTGAVRELLSELVEPDLRPSRLFGLLRACHSASLQAWAMATEDRVLAERLHTYLTELRGVTTALSGRDIIELGAVEGPLIGELLRELLDARLNGLIASREEEVQLVLSRLDRSGAQEDPRG